MKKRRTTFSSCQFLGGMHVSWTPKQQSCVSTSVDEEKYLVADSCWCKHNYMIMDSKVPKFASSTIPLMQLSYLTTMLSTPWPSISTFDINSSKEIPIKVISSGIFSHRRDVIDIFTKALDETKFQYFLGHLGILNLDNINS